MDKVLNNNRIIDKYISPINMCCMYKKEIFLLESVSTGKTHLVKYLNEKELKEMKIYRTEYK